MRYGCGAPRVVRRISIACARAAAASLLGWVLLAMGRIVESVDVLQEAVHRAPDSGLCWSQLALAHVARERHFEARRCAERALSLGGDGTPQLLDDVTRVYLATGDLDVAERCARDAGAARACVRARVEVLLRRGEREQAAVALRAALHEFPHDPVLAHLDAVLRQPPPKSPPPKSSPPPGASHRRAPSRRALLRAPALRARRRQITGPSGAR